MSSWITELLETTRRTNKLHESFLRDLCETYHLTMTEASIICFLKNNPQLDTAADIVEYKMLAKSHVSQAVESLIQKSMLARTADPHDRRRQHLSLLPASAPVTDSIQAVQELFFQELFSGFTEDEQNQFFAFNQRIINNTKNMLERRNYL